MEEIMKENYSELCENILKNLTSKNLTDIINNTKAILEKAIESGGTTIHTYTSVDGITGRFQQELLVHNKKSVPCPTCKTEIIKIQLFKKKILQITQK